jgi:hypothetical protein
LWVQRSKESVGRCGRVKPVSHVGVGIDRPQPKPRLNPPDFSPSGKAVFAFCEAAAKSPIMKPAGLSRRTLLKGMGVAMGLPLLEAMRPLTATAGTGAASARRFPTRFAVLYMPNGVNPHHWTPKARGSDFELTEVLAPLKELQREILVLTNLWNAATDTGDGHYVKTGGFLTSTTITRTTGANLCSGNTSMDQLIARRIGHLTPLPSLELGIEPITTGVDTNVGFTRLYGSHIAWSTPTTPLAKEINPKLAFDRLFRSNAATQQSRFGDNTSILDLVADDAKRLERSLGQADRQKLNEYFDSVRAVEKRIEWDRRRKTQEYLTDPQARAEIEKVGRRIDVYLDPARASERGIDHTEQVQLMLDIMALAFWTDSTRVSTFMFGNAVSGRNFSFLDGVKGGHHEYSHHENKAEKLEPYKRIGIWHLTQYAYLLNKLRSIREGEGTLLDNSMILFGAGMRDGNAHSPHNLPLVLAGRGAGSLATGRHVVYGKDTPMANLHVGLLNRMGVPTERFADSTGELAGLNSADFSGVT